MSHGEYAHETNGRTHNKGTSLWNFVSNNMGLKTFASKLRPLQVLSTLVDALCDIVATDVGRQFITLRVHLCVPDDGLNAARRAFASAVAELLVIITDCFTDPGRAIDCVCLSLRTITLLLNAVNFDLI